MPLRHVVAVFKAEYYTTTAKFRQYRKWIPILFLSGVLFFSYTLRLLINLFSGEQNLQAPPLGSFFSIIAIFSYFTLFAPLLSPLGRIIYDGGARSRREVALSSPVESRDLLYGNLLSNLAFFLPFFAFVGTITLAPFIGNGIYTPAVTAFMLFLVMSLLILIGLVTGTLISPIIYNFISAQKNAYARAFVTFSLSIMLVISLPLLRFFLETVGSETTSLGWLTYLPFTLAASSIIFILYGVEMVVNPVHANSILVIYILILVLLGYFKAETLYGLENEEAEITEASPESLSNKVLRLITKPLPRSLRSPTRSILKASLRDIEHISRLTIGIAITIFMIFALSSKGLFRGSTNFSQNIELAVAIFALVLSAASVIFIEASSFTVQHRDMFALIKSAPKGPQSFVYSKIIQMIYLLSPIFLLLIFSLSRLDMIGHENTAMLSFIVLAIIYMLICLSLAVYLVNPADNQEDLTNFINLLFFYLVSFAMAILPVVVVITGTTINLIQMLVFFLMLGGLGISSIILSIKALDQMDLETLSSNLSRSILRIVQAVILFIIGWNILPLFALGYFLSTFDVLGLLLLSALLTLVLPLIYFWRSKPMPEFSLPHKRKIGITIILYILMLGTGIIASLISGIWYTTELIPYSSLDKTLGLSSNQVIIVLVISVLSEEFFFRYFILDYLCKETSTWVGIFISSLLFAVIHIYNPISLINALLLGMVLAYSRLRTGSLLIPVLLHLTYNLTLSLFV